MPNITQRLLAARGVTAINQGIEGGPAPGRGWPPEYYGNRRAGDTGPAGYGMGGQPETGMHGGADYGQVGDIAYDPFTQSYGSYGGQPPAAQGYSGEGPAYSDLPLSYGSPQHPFDVQSAGPISPEVITSLAGMAENPRVGQNIPPNEDVGLNAQNQWWQEPYDPSTGLYGGKPNPTYPWPGGGYPMPGDTGAGNWAANAQKPIYPGPGYTNPAAAGQWAQGLADWQAGGWQPNVSDPEAAGGQDPELQAMIAARRM